ncbi:MAG: VWA domain-containing protein [Peptococcaceae bacterium]|nr:VWA domain-containing protein [Peptococcaceae bacterium]
MFINFYYQLKSEGVPVSLNEWMTLMEALARGLAFSSLTGFYYLARAVLVKSEAHFDRYDLAFAQYFKGVETAEDIIKQALDWLTRSLPPLRVPLGERSPFSEWDLEEMRRQLEERLKKQDSEHHGGSQWIGTGGTSPFGHSGYHPAGLRIGGESVNRSAVKVAARRLYRDFRDDRITGTRQFEVALRKLRQFSTRTEGPKDVLDLDGTIDATSKKGGALHLVWQRPRRNMMKVILLMDSGGSMNPYIQTCSRLFTAANRTTHFKDLKFYYFHNCVYDYVYTSPILVRRHAVQTEEILRSLNSDYRLIVVGDASMAPSELTMAYGAINWEADNEEPGIVWLERLARHFPYSAWLNPIPAGYWDRTEGSYTINLIRNIFPMFELTPEGLEQAVKTLKAKKQ